MTTLCPSGSEAVPGRRLAARGDPPDPRRRSRRDLEGLADARRVVAAARPQRAGQLVVPVRLRRPAAFLEAAAERVVRVVVRGREVEHHPELGLGLLVTAQAEVRDPERLADRGLVGLSPLRLLEGDRGLSGHALSEVVPALLEKLV